MDINSTLAKEFNLRIEQVNNAVSLIDDGQTIPFIARYRKEQTGSLDDQVLRELFDRLTYLRNLEKRKAEIVSSITEQEKMTDEIAAAIEKAGTLVEVEDIYRPFKPKRKTRASVAREKGLEKLAEIIMEQNVKTVPADEAAAFVGENMAESAEEALQGAMDIIAEDISDNAELRKALRDLYFKKGKITSAAAAEDANEVYKNYFEYSEAVSTIAGHRVLALDRGEKEGALKVSVALADGEGENLCIRRFVKKSGECSELVKAACEDSCKRLIFPSIEREIRAELSENAQEGAIKVFSSNLRQLLMAPPVKNTVTLGLDPGYAHGCKAAVVDHTGKVLDTTIVYLTPPRKETQKAKRILTDMIKKYGVTTISIGNGTASRETEQFTAEMLKEIPEKVSYMVVSEAGASVYSASKLAAEEFPDYDVSLRSAVSIARRLQDPLAELVKIDPKAIGVGQYQHDMPKARMSDALKGVVEDCVNSVGVDVNTASYSLLSYISGINSAVAKNIVAYREENGEFTDRKQLLKVKKLGAKAYEQCAGFLRVPGAKNPLDNTGIHPESYKAAQSLLESCGLTYADIGHEDTIKSKTDSIGLPQLSKSTGAGIPTLADIVKELEKPGRDPRDELPPPLMRSGDIMELKDLNPGMELMGTVRNVIDFGAFVDIGVHEDGLVHISQLSNKFVKHPLEVVKVGDVVKVWVLDVDMKRKRISLTMKKP
ncbi:Tex family protein [uncultured Ruminococcus sp.]|uniref:Tex family protein n=1 Tax=uncultured Ruminococcus sp. TaxID=165186 RepID=UPI0025E82195|nr:Tex family protein [uncultured Ruminococcus sp.]